jgi:hypothetical protein
LFILIGLQLNEQEFEEMMVHQLAHLLLSDDQVRALSGWEHSVVAVLVPLVSPRVFPQQPLPVA